MVIIFIKTETVRQVIQKKRNENKKLKILLSK